MVSSIGIIHKKSYLILQLIFRKRLNSSIWTIDGTLTESPENNGNKRLLQIPQTLRLEPHNQIEFNVIPKTLPEI